MLRVLGIGSLSIVHAPQFLERSDEWHTLSPELPWFGAAYPHISLWHVALVLRAMERPVEREAGRVWTLDTEHLFTLGAQSQLSINLNYQSYLLVKFYSEY